MEFARDVQEIRYMMEHLPVFVLPASRANLLLSAPGNAKATKTLMRREIASVVD